MSRFVGVWKDGKQYKQGIFILSDGGKIRKGHYPSLNFLHNLKLTPVIPHQV